MLYPKAAWSGYAFVPAGLCRGFLPQFEVDEFTYLCFAKK